jgi:hypothetical protein
MPTGPPVRIPCEIGFNRVVMKMSNAIAHTLLVVIAMAPLAACSDSSRGTSRTAAPANAAAAAPGTRSSDPTALAGASPAPGSERFEADPHPEQAQPDLVTTESLAAGIKEYVDTEAARQGGVFRVSDPQQNTSLALTLATVHRERVSRLADGRFFACADFKGADGHTYDLDIFMRSQSNGLTPTEVIVHKQDGKPRFEWIEQNGVWSQRPIGGE